MNEQRRRGSFATVGDIIAANRASGGYFFAPETMRFFRSRVLAGVIGGCLFITSERSHRDAPRRYTVRVAYADGDVESLDARDLPTASQARARTREYACHNFHKSRVARGLNTRERGRGSFPARLLCAPGAARALAARLGYALPR